uniref:polynucleotide adenylyltransferase n=1 Tax=Dicentrarchus labrax TaxID=13489 RepID=A0A8C4DTQ9_DICLA
FLPHQSSELVSSFQIMVLLQCSGCSSWDCGSPFFLKGDLFLPFIVAAKVGGKIFPFGSFYLGVHSKGMFSFLNCKSTSGLEDFFTSFLEKLKAQKEATDIFCLSVLKFCLCVSSWWFLCSLIFYMDLVFAQLAQRSIPDNLDLLNNNLLRNLDSRCVRSLNGYRVTVEILRHVPNVHTFRLVLRATKLWVKREKLNIHLFICCGVKWSMNCDLKLPVWCPGMNPSDRTHIMPIIPPAYPYQNTSFNGSPSTFAIITGAIERGHTTTSSGATSMY